MFFKCYQHNFKNLHTKLFKNTVAGKNFIWVLKTLSLDNIRSQNMKQKPNKQIQEL